MEISKAHTLFEPIKLRGLELANRVIMAPMCQYSAIDGQVQDWHLRHYTERAIGGVGLVIVEASAVQAIGRISPADLGIWTDQQLPGLRQLTQSVHAAGAKIAIQLAHAGRKASTPIPWLSGGSLPLAAGGWQTVSASALPFDQGHAIPTPLDDQGITALIKDFAMAAQRAVQAGFDSVEIHGAHGYLLHQFLSPLSNQRSDGYGGDQAGRFRLATAIVRAVRAVLPAEMPLMIRLSASDWVEGGWDLDQTIALLNILKTEGVDFADISSGGLVPGVKIPIVPGYQVPLSARIRRETGLATGAVGLITSPEQAEAILANGDADAILFGRLLLRDPYFPARSAPADSRHIPVQYIRGF